jgi:hypothetical protein
LANIVDDVCGQKRLPSLVDISKVSPSTTF